MKATPEDVAKDGVLSTDRMLLALASMKATPEDVAKPISPRRPTTRRRNGLNEGHA